MACKSCGENNIRFTDILKKIVLNSEEKSEARLNVCRGCEHFDVKYYRCRKCGCFLRIKARLKGFGCPEGKWENEGQ